MFATKCACPACGAMIESNEPLPTGEPLQCMHCGAGFSLLSPPSEVKPLNSPTMTFTPSSQPAAAQALDEVDDEPHSPTMSFTPGNTPAKLRHPLPADGKSPTMSFKPEGKGSGTIKSAVTRRTISSRTDELPSREKRAAPGRNVGLVVLLVSFCFVMVGLAVAGSIYGVYWFMKKTEDHPLGENVKLIPKGANRPNAAQQPVEEPAKKVEPEETKEPAELVGPKIPPRLPIHPDGTPWVGMGVGNQALDIEGEDLDGKFFKLSDYRGKVVLLDFWGDWCPYCRQMYPYEKQLVSRMGNRPFALLGVNNDKTKAIAKKALQNDQVNARSWWDGGETESPITRQWMVHGFPTFFVIDHKGILRDVTSGVPRDLVAMDKLIDDLVSQVEKDNGKKTVAAGETVLKGDKSRTSKEK